MKLKIALICGLILLLGTLAYAADVTTWDFGLKPCKTQVTGQDTQYDSQADDGSLQKGKARSLTALTTGQYSGTTAIAVSGKTINMENDCVTDNNSGLMWMKYTPDSDLGPGNDGNLYWYKAADTNNIFAFCAAANAASLAGHDDWRVPNVFELFSLVVCDIGIGAPFIDTTYFQCVSAGYWSSTTNFAGTTEAWVIPFTPAAGVYLIYGRDKDTTLYYVRLVRNTP